MDGRDLLPPLHGLDESAALRSIVEGTATHTGARFFETLVESLARVQRLAAGRLGRDLFFYSLTVDPERDSPRALRDFAASHGAGPGWLFLTGESAALLDLRQRLFAHGPGHVHGAEGADCAMAMLRYGNAAVGLWGAVPARTDPQWIVQRLSWVESREQYLKFLPSLAEFPAEGSRAQAFWCLPLVAEGRTIGMIGVGLGMSPSRTTRPLIVPHSPAARADGWADKTKRAARTNGTRRRESIA